MSLSTQPYKGARDFYPKDQRLQKYVFSTWRKVVERYGYEEYNAPTIEFTELYKAKTGDEIVNEQTYSFEDRGGRDVTIRPEMTPSVARMVAGRRQELSYPLRWYSIPNLWRYERPQRGRLREHWQLNVDLFGVSTIDAELEMIAIAHRIMTEFGADEGMFAIRVNSRKLISLIMADYLELDPMQSHMMMKLLDRKSKMNDESFKAQAAQIFDSANSKDGVKKLVALTEAKSMGDLPETLTQSTAVKGVQVLFTHLRDMHMTNVVFDVSLMRGFDYYTDIVFEVYDTNPENNRSMFGGGRYDGLVGLFGVEPVPTIGFGMGDVTMANFLEAHNLVPDLKPETDVYIIVIGDLLRQAQGVARLLRAEGVNVAVDLSARKPDKQIKSALKKSIPYALFVGEQELDTERFKLKELATQEEEELSIERIITKLLDNRNQGIKTRSDV